ncbi:protein SOGA3-like [Patiria miniata]|uniref:Uncharacterized protein n=1 Tax=Patiria miniata TaxID=46514 RepID=A0A914AF14_PATMI|nr:protein SOGA3-like [Patiria miniata]
MGSRPSSSYAGTNGTLTNQAETALRTENNQLKEKINAFEKLEPDKLKQENEELKRLNEELQTELQNIRESTSQKSITDSSEQVNNMERANKETKEKQRSTRRINSNLTPQRMSDIDAYGQGIPLEKHPPITIKSRRKRHKKKDTNGEPDESERGSAKETNNDQSHEMGKVNDQGQREPTESLTPEKDPDATSVNKEQQIAIDSGQSLGSTTPCLSVVDDDDEKKSFQESDLLS